MAEVLWLHLCQQITENEKGNATIHDDFDQMTSPFVPGTAPDFLIAARVRADKRDRGRGIWAQIIAPNGMPLSSSGHYTINTAPSRAIVRFPLSGLEIREYGEYKVQLLMDDQVIATTSFEALQKYEPLIHVSLGPEQTINDD